MRAETYNLLTRPRRTADSIQELERRLKGLQDSMLPKANYDQERVQASRSDAMSRYAERVDCLSNEIDELRMQYLDEVRAIEDAISRLDDNNERSVLSMRYLSRMRYEDIADKMHYSIDSIYRIHRQAAKKLNSE